VNKTASATNILENKVGNLYKHESCQPTRSDTLTDPKGSCIDTSHVFHISSFGCSSLGLKHRLHTCLERGLIERGAILYFKDRTENFDDYYPCTKSRLCNLSHVYKWLSLFVCMHNAMIANIKFSILRYVIGGETIQLS
jgi:hypothetical protein